MTTKNKDRLKRQFENATPEQLGEALAAARHVLTGIPDDAESKLIVEYIESLELGENEITAPDTVKVEAKQDCSVDGVRYSKGHSGIITKKQYHALSRFFKIVSALALLCILLPAARAQQYTITAISNSGGWGVVYNGGTNNILTNGLSGTNIVTVTKIRHFCVQANFKLMAAGTAGVLITEYHAGDGTNYETTGVTKVITAAGTTPVTGTIERTNGIAGYYRYDILNSNTAIVTNLQFLLIDPGVKDN